MEFHCNEKKTKPPTTNGHLYTNLEQYFVGATKETFEEGEIGTS